MRTLSIRMRRPVYGEGALQYPPSVLQHSASFGMPRGRIFAAGYQRCSTRWISPGGIAQCNAISHQYVLKKIYFFTSEAIYGFEEERCLLR